MQTSKSSHTSSLSHQKMRIKWWCLAIATAMDASRLLYCNSILHGTTLVNCSDHVKLFLALSQVGKELSTTPTHYSLFLWPLKPWVRSSAQGNSSSQILERHTSNPTPLTSGISQSSILFTRFISPISSLITDFGIQHQLFADDTQLFAAFLHQTLLILSLKIILAF